MRELFRRDHTGMLRPASAEAEDMVKHLPKGQDLWVEIKRPRNARHHRKFFALLRFVHDNLPEHLEKRWPTVERLRWEVIVQTGRCAVVTTLGDKTVVVPESISFSSMDQQEFDELYRDAIHVVCKFVLPAFGESELRDLVEREVMRFL